MYKIRCEANHVSDFHGLQEIDIVDGHTAWPDGLLKQTGKVERRIHKRLFERLSHQIPAENLMCGILFLWLRQPDRRQ